MILCFYGFCMPVYLFFVSPLSLCVSAFFLFWFAWICFVFLYCPVYFLNREKEGKELGWGGREYIGDEEGERVQNILYEKVIFNLKKEKNLPPIVHLQLCPYGHSLNV